jgi:putative ABC transport system permease protein
MLASGTLGVIRALVLRPILREKTRTVLTILGIAVGVAVVIAIQLSSQSALRAFRESVDAIAGRANYQIVSESAPIDEALLLKLQPLWARGVRFAPVIDVEGAFEPGQLPIRLLAVDLLSDLHFRDYRYARVAVSAEGKATPAGAYFELFRDDSVIIPSTFAREHRLAIGSPLSLTLNGITRTLIVRGILETEGPATAFNGSMAIADIAMAQRQFGMIGRLSRIDLMVPEAAADSIVRELRRMLPPNARIERPSRRNERVAKMLRAFRVNLFALAGVALLVGMFLVYNTVLISILRRRRDVGVFKTLGVSTAQIFVAFLLEGALFGLAGGALGVLLGKGIAVGVLDLIGRTINTLYVTSRPESVTLTPGIVAVGLLVGALLSIVSAIQPSLEAAALRPSVLIRAGLQQRITRAAMARLCVLSAIAFALAAGTSLLPPVHGIAVAGYVAVLFVVIGFSLLSPLIVTAAARIVRAPLGRAFGVVGKLAAASLPSALRRTAVASAALSLATGMMVAVALMVGSFRETVNIWVKQTVTSDLWLRPARQLSNSGPTVFPASIVSDLQKIDFIAAFEAIKGRTLIYDDDLISVGGADFKVAAEFGDLPSIGRSSRDMLRAALRENGVNVSESFSLKFRKKIGDRIELPTAHGTRSFPIEGIYRDYSNDRGSVMMDRALYLREFGDDTINTVAVYLKKGISPDEGRRRLERLLGAKYHAFAFTNASIRREVMTIFDQTFLITYALLAVAIIVAVLGIVNTLAALILERRHEIALFRVLGMSMAEVRRMVLLESALLGAISTVLGLVTGYVLSLILIYVINKQSFGWTIAFHTPVALIAGSLSATFVASVMAGLLPSRLANRIDIAGSLKRE